MDRRITMTLQRATQNKEPLLVRGLKLQSKDSKEVVKVTKVDNHFVSYQGKGFRGDVARNRLWDEFELSSTNERVVKDKAVAKIVKKSVKEKEKAVSSIQIVFKEVDLTVRVLGDKCCITFGPMKRGPV